MKSHSSRRTTASPIALLLFPVALLLPSVAFDGAIAAEAPGPAPAVPSREAAAPAAGVVRIGGTDLFVLRAPVGSISPPERAELANRRLAVALRDPKVGPEQVIAVTRGHSVIIEAGGEPVLEVTPEDAAAYDSSPPVLANLWADLIRKELGRRKSEMFSLVLIGRWVIRMIYPVAILLLLWAGLRLIERLRERVRQRPQATLPALTVMGITLLKPRGYRRLRLRSLWLLRVALFLGFGYALLVVLFAQFPRTQSYAWDMLLFVTDLLAGGLGRLLDWLPPLAAALVVLAAARGALRLNRMLFARARAGRAAVAGDPRTDTAALSESIVRAAIILLAAALLALLVPGEGGQAMLAVLFLVLLVAALALVPAARQIAAGILLAYVRAAPAGSRLEVEGARGTVVRRDLLHTIVRTDGGEEVWLPNLTLLSGRLTRLEPPIDRPPAP